jgi:ammonium transporter, Amt family
MDGSLTLNGALAGLVSITAGAGNLDFWGALAAGLISGVILVEAVRLIEHKVKVDDPVGAVTVHGVVGIWGTLAVGLLDTAGGGLLYGGGAELLGIQAIGVIAVLAWTTITTAAGLALIKVFVPLRVPAEEEIKGLDVVEHGSSAYEMQDVFKGVTRSSDSFAQRLTTLGHSSNVQDKKA